MTVELKSKEENKAVYTVDTDWDCFEEEVQKVYQRSRGRFSIPGFRKGHAPRQIIEANYGSEVFYEDALNAILPELLQSATEELELEPIGRPDVDVATLEKGKPVVFTITTELKPHPQLGDYHKIEVEKKEAKVSDEAIRQVMENEQKKNAVARPVTDRPAKDGDTVVLDYKGSIDGEEFQGGSAEKYELTLGSKTFIPGFEDQVVGHESGEDFVVKVTFPEDYHAKELAGKEAEFACKLHEIREKDLPELNDEFAQDVSEYDTLEEYRESIRKVLMEEAEKSVKAQQENEAIEKLIEISNVKVPKAMIDDQVEDEVRNLANQVQQMGLKLDQYLTYTKMTLEQLREQYKPMAEVRVSGDLVLESLAEEQKLEVTDEEAEKEIRRLGEVYGAKDIDDFAKRVKDSGNTVYVKEDLKKRKAIDYLMEQVQYVEPKEEADKEDKKEEKVAKKSSKKEAEKEDASVEEKEEK